MKCHPSNSCVNSETAGIDVKITNKCNANCAFCIEKGGYNPEEKDVESLILATNTLDQKIVLILGGEPLLYPHLEKYLEGIKGKDIYLTTNGILLNAEIAKMLSKHLTAINISIHHSTERKNAEVYNVSEYPFEGIMAANRVFNRCRVPVRINCNLVKGIIETRNDIQKMVHFAEFIGANSIRFNELQNCESLYVDARELVYGLNRDPYTHGCEQTIFETENITVTIKVTCGIVNKLKSPISDPLFKPTKRRVVYPDSSTHPGWRSTAVSCHGSSRGGCH